MVTPAPLTLIVEGKPLVFDVSVPVGEVIPAGTWFAFSDPAIGTHVDRLADDLTAHDDDVFFTARPPVAPESFADGDVAWVRVTYRDDFSDGGGWHDADGDRIIGVEMGDWLAAGDAFLCPSPESLADVLDDLGLTAELRARVEKAVGANG